jgi:hypothetical protein
MSTPTAHRVISLKLQRKRYDAEYVERYIMYRGAKLTITDEMFTELLSLIPEVWNSDKDRLTQFVMFEDNTFFCVRNKDIYNFSTKETEDKTYFFNAATPQQVSKIVKILTDYFAKKKLEEVDNFYDTIINSLSDLSFVKQRLLYMRNMALAQSDYMFNSDYQFKNEEIKQSWIDYRQEWRDITGTDAWKNNDLQSLSVPVAPRSVDTFQLVLGELKYSLSSVEVTDSLLDELNMSVDCVNYDNVSRNFGEIYFKLEILKTLGKLKIPFATDAESEIDNIEESLSNVKLLPMDVYTRFKSIQEIEGEETPFTMKQILDQQISDIDAKIVAIDSKLREYNVDFTISDILEKFLADTKVRAQEIERQYEAESLIADLQVSGDES